MKASEDFGRRMLRQSPPSSDRSFTVGLLAATSGVQGLHGPGAYACARLACGVWNEEGGVDGREVKLTLVDTGAEPAKLNAELESLLAQDSQGRRKVDALITVSNTAACLTISRIVGARVPMVYTPHFEGAGLPDWVHAIGETPDRQLVPAIDWVAKRHQVRRWFLLGQDYCWPRQTHRRAVDHIRSRGDQVVAERYVPLGEQRFEAVIEQIARSGADAVLLSLIGTDAVHMCRAFGKAGLSSRVLRVSTAIDECALLGMGHQNTDGMYIAHGYFAAVDSAANEAFQTRYKARFGERAPTLGSPTQSIYEGFVHLHRQAMQREGQPLRTALRTARGNRSGVSDPSQDPIYLACAQGLDLQVIDSIAGRG